MKVRDLIKKLEMFDPALDLYGYTEDEKSQPLAHRYIFWMSSPCKRASAC